MENVKNNFEEMKKLLLGALEILEQTNGGLVERIQELEGRVEVLEERVKELEQHAVADIEAYAPTASLFAASAAEVNDEVEETSETEIFEAEQAETEQVEAEQAEQVETEQAEAGQAEHAELEEAEQEDQLQEQPMESEEQPVESQEQAGSAGAELAESTETAEAEPAEQIEPAEQTEPAETATAESYEFAEVEQFEEAEQFAEAEQPAEAEQFEAEQQLDGEQQVPEFEAAGAFETETGAGTETGTETGTGTETVGTMMINDFVADEQRKIVNEAAKPDWYDWEVDYPAAYVDDVYKGISFNDRFEFIKELFNVTGSLDEAEMAFKETLDMINSLENFKQVVAYIRERFPQWDEQSDEVYRFYMAVRRKFNK